MPVAIKRAYDLSELTPGYRILVDRIWPRGLKKADLNLDEWLRDVSPSNDLRKWYGHDVSKWNEFKKRYELELESHRDEINRIRKLSENKIVLLIYSARDKAHNQAIVLKKRIEISMDSV